MIERVEATVLGKTISSPISYKPNILVAVPRDENRVQYNISSNNLPFVGVDVWNAYEVSFLTNSGLPISTVAKITYNSNSKCIVESKSLKLYLNSLNMMKYGSNVESSKVIVRNIIESDLSNLLGTEVKCMFYKVPGLVDILHGYTQLQSAICVDNITFNSFNEDPSLIKFKHTSISDYTKVYCDILRSNCKITHAPDFGTVVIHIKSENIINLESLLQYIVSFRGENHFHEEVCEMIYKRLFDILKPDELAVTCLYTRRGGIDICPSRATSLELLNSSLISSDRVVAKLINQ